jgi:hypothetical protein
MIPLLQFIFIKIQVQEICCITAGFVEWLPHSTRGRPIRQKLRQPSIGCGCASPRGLSRIGTCMSKSLIVSMGFC